MTKNQNDKMQKKEKDKKKLEVLELLNDGNRKQKLNKGVTKKIKIKTQNCFLREIETE